VMAVFIGHSSRCLKTDGRCLFLDIERNGGTIRTPHHSNGCALVSVDVQRRGVRRQREGNEP
jgi:hypothetical protein